MRRGEMRSQLQSLTVKFRGLLRVPLVARLLRLLERKHGLVRRLCQHDAERSALRRQKRERPLRKPRRTHAQRVSTGRELELKFPARVRRAAPHFVNPDDCAGLRADS